MARRLSNRLSSRAKKLLLQPETDTPVTGLLQLAPSADRPSLQRLIEGMGGSVRANLAETGNLSIEISSKHLAELADLPGVVYVEVGERYGR